MCPARLAEGDSTTHILEAKKLQPRYDGSRSILPSVQRLDWTGEKLRNAHHEFIVLLSEEDNIEIERAAESFEGIINICLAQ